MKKFRYSVPAEVFFSIIAESKVEADALAQDVVKSLTYENMEMGDIGEAREVEACRLGTEPRFFDERELEEDDLIECPLCQGCGRADGDNRCPACDGSGDLTAGDWRDYDNELREGGSETT